MGNFSVSHYARLTPVAGGVDVVFALDLAEIPTFELMQTAGLPGESPKAEIQRLGVTKMPEWLSRVRFTTNGRALAPRIISTEAQVVDGAGGLPQLRVAARLRVDAPAGGVTYEDRNFEGRAGWKEIVIGDAKDLSNALRAYPDDPLSAPPQQLTASVTVPVAPSITAPSAAPPVTMPVPATPVPVAPAPAPQGTVVKGDFLSTLLTRKELPLQMVLLGILAAFGLGAMHAMSPGHGKTIVAAYLVGSRGTMKHAAFLGAIVTFTHVFSVFALGFVTLFLSQYIVPEKIYPYLGAISGLTIVVVGVSLFRKRIAAFFGKAHSHSHGHHHHHRHGDGDHHHHEHEHGPDTHTHVPEGEVTMGSLIALGISGGLVPCPSALVLLLSAIAIGRTGFGLLLLTSFSVGLALVLMAIGMAVLFAKNRMPSIPKVTGHPVFRFVPVLSAFAIVCLGLLMTGASLGVIGPIG